MLIKVAGCQSSARGLLLFGLTALAGCCSSSNFRNQNTNGAAASLPGPLDISLHGIFSVNLATVESADFVPPAQGEVSLEFHSHALSTQPLRSNFHAAFKLLVTNPEKTLDYVKVDSELTGESDGSPVNGAEQAFTALERTLDLVGRASATTQSSPH